MHGGCLSGKACWTPGWVRSLILAAVPVSWRTWQDVQQEVLKRGCRQLRGPGVELDGEYQCQAPCIGTEVLGVMFKRIPSVPS